MKKNELSEIKKMESKALVDKAKKLRAELADLEMDKNMKKLTSLKDLRNKQKDLAQTLTVLRQKTIVAQLEGGQDAKAS